MEKDEEIQGVSKFISQDLSPDHMTLTKWQRLSERNHTSISSKNDHLLEYALSPVIGSWKQTSGKLQIKHYNNMLFMNTNFLF